MWRVSILSVGRAVNRTFELLDLNLEAVLNLVEDLGVVLVCDERDGKTLGAETTGTSDTVQVPVGTACSARPCPCVLVS
jgi:hypothetical protein